MKKNLADLMSDLTPYRKQSLVRMRDYDKAWVNSWPPPFARVLLEDFEVRESQTVILCNP